ncbi:MAG: hypothetical protein RJA69_1042, partial [Pseudomonadota bacterium]
MQHATFRTPHPDRRDSLKRLSLGAFGLSTWAGSGALHAATGFSSQGLGRIAPAMSW